MTRSFLNAALLTGILAQPASAHMIWLEREGPTVQMFFGEPDENLRERTGATLDIITRPMLIGHSASSSRQPDHIAFGPVPAGDARAIEEMTPRDDRERGGRTRYVFLAREGRAETKSAMDLELVPVTSGGSAFTLLFRGQPLPRTKVMVVSPPGWTKDLQTNAEGQVTLPMPWAGRYVTEVQHLHTEAGGQGAEAYQRTSYVSTISFAVEAGIPWAGQR